MADDGGAAATDVQRAGDDDGGGGGGDDGGVEKMAVYVHVNEKALRVSCGRGQQPVKWLGSVGVARYDASRDLRNVDLPTGVRLEDGTSLDLEVPLNTVVTDGMHVWLVLPSAEDDI